MNRIAVDENDNSEIVKVVAVKQDRIYGLTSEGVQAIRKAFYFYQDHDLFCDTVLHCIYAGIWSKQNVKRMKTNIEYVLYDSMIKLQLSMKRKIHLTIIAMYKQTCVTKEKMMECYNDNSAVVDASSQAYVDTSIGNKLEKFMTTGTF